MQIAPAEQRMPRRLNVSFNRALTPKSDAARSGGGGKQQQQQQQQQPQQQQQQQPPPPMEHAELDRELESVMAGARDRLLHSGGDKLDKEAVLSECREQFDTVAERFPAASESADYYVTRARFEEFCGQHEAVAELYAAAAKNNAEPRDVVQNNFIQFLSRQSASLLKAAGKTSASTASASAGKAFGAPRSAQKLPATPKGKSAGAQCVKTPSSLGGGARRVAVQRPTPTRNVSAGPKEQHFSRRSMPKERPVSAAKVLPIASLAKERRVSVVGALPVTPSSVRRSPSLGPAQRVRTPVHTAAVLSFEDADTDVDDFAETEAEDDGALPTTLQNYVKELRHNKPQPAAEDDTENQQVMTSAVVFSPVRVKPSQVDKTGARTALTPVRRSPRLSYNTDSTKQSLDEMLAATEYCYQPNGSVKALM